MNPTIKEQLRKNIEAKYQEALAALDVIGEYIGETEPNLPGGAVTIAARITPVANGKKLTIREKVIGSIIEKTSTVDQIADETRLDPRQVRGVLNAPDLHDKIKRDRNGEGEAIYQFSTE